MWSWQAIRILAAVAGAFNVNKGSTPDSFLASLIASRIAKSIELAKNKGGSPTAYKIIEFAKVY